MCATMARHANSSWCASGATSRPHCSRSPPGLRAQLADLKMPGALEALDVILRQVDGGQIATSEAISAVLPLADPAPESAPLADCNSQCAPARGEDTRRFGLPLPAEHQA